MAPRVTTSCGPLRGSEEAVLVFRGIPFAAAPVGELRWRAPEPMRPWNTEREATAFGPAALQRTAPGGVAELIGIPSQPTDEDCLYLNVWTPGLEGRRPVLVWVHGGGNVVGSGSQPRVNGEPLARRGDAVVVTFNYRLGAFGFLHAPQLGAGGNEALLDQIAALRWVRREIAAFGGDPANVTVFGQSAGGVDIAQLMALPDAAGCFDRAAMMSGSLSPQLRAEDAARTAEQFATRFGGMERLRQVPAEEILEYQVELARTGTRFGPVRDGQLIRGDAASVLGNPVHTRGMPLLIGTTREESALFTAGSNTLAGLDEAGLERLAQRRVGDCAPHVLEVYRKSREARGAGMRPGELWVALLTDWTFRLPAIRTAELHCAHTPQTWMYLFDHASPAWGGRLGACHSLDIPFVWGTHGTPGMQSFCGEGPGVCALSERMMDLYLAFARHGDPTSPDLPHWPAYTAQCRSTLHLDEHCWVEDAPMEAERRVLASLRS
jgi:para-nitrobenzyl esterase